MTIINVSKNLA